MTCVMTDRKFVRTLYHLSVPPAKRFFKKFIEKLLMNESFAKIQLNLHNVLKLAIHPRSHFDASIKLKFVFIIGAYFHGMSFRTQVTHVNRHPPTSPRCVQKTLK